MWYVLLFTNRNYDDFCKKFCLSCKITHMQLRLSYTDLSICDIYHRKKRKAEMKDQFFKAMKLLIIGSSCYS